MPAKDIIVKEIVALLSGSLESGTLVQSFESVLERTCSGIERFKVTLSKLTGRDARLEIDRVIGASSKD